MVKVNLDEYPFHYKIKTRWKDLDAFGHVNNAVYLTYLEDARMVLFKRWNLNDASQSLIMASIKLDYLRQLTHPLDLIIVQKISRLGNSSFDIQSAIMSEEDDNPFAVGTIVCVCFDYIKNISIPVYETIKKDLRKNS